MSASKDSKGSRADRRRARLRIVIAVIAAVVTMGLPFASSSVARASGSTAPAAAGGTWRIMKPTNTGIPGDYVYSMAVDAADHPWMTADDPIWDEGGLGTLQGSVWKQWTNVDGKSPTHMMTNLTFDKNGTAWMASDIGLLSFDGKKVRKVWSMANAPWPTNHVTDFGWDSTGTLWVALSDVATVHGGVARYDGSSWTMYTTANGLPWVSPWDQVSSLQIDSLDRVWIGSPVLGGAVYSGGTWSALGNGSGTWVQDIAIAPDGTPWFAFSGTGVKTWDGTKWIDRTGPFGTSDISLVTIDRTGRVWIGTYIGAIWRWSGSGSTWDLTYRPPSLTSHIYGLAFDSRNRPWVGGIGGATVRQLNGSWKVYRMANTALPSRWVDHITIDASGRGWFSTADGGLASYDGKRWTDYNPDNWGTAPWPFDTNGARVTVQDPTGTLWTAPTMQGVGQWNGSAWTEHLPFYDIRSLAVAPDGSIYAAQNAGPVLHWNGSAWLPMGNPSGSADTNHVAVDNAGIVWLATSIGLMRFDGTNWTTYTTSNSGLPSNFVITVEASPSGEIWVGTDNGLAKLVGSTWTVYRETNGLPANVVDAIAFAPNGHVWVGAFDGIHFPYHGGVGDFDGATWVSYTTANSPLPHNQVTAITVDTSGKVWIGTAGEGAATLMPAA